MFYDNNDHSNYLGFTWQRCMVGKVPVGIDTNDTDFNLIGKTGGEKTHTLTISEIPSHYHDLTVHSGGTTAAPIAGVANTANAPGRGLLTNPSFRIQNTGGGQAHNNLQPYEVVSYWRRVS